MKTLKYVEETGLSSPTCFKFIILIKYDKSINANPMNANVMLQDAMFIREQFAHIIHA